MIEPLKQIDFLIEIVLVPLFHTKRSDVGDTSQQFIKPCKCWANGNGFETPEVSCCLHVRRSEADIQPCDEHSKRSKLGDHNDYEEEGRYKRKRPRQRIASGLLESAIYDIEI